MTSAKVKRADMARAAWQIMADLVLDNQRRREVAEAVGLSFGKTRALRRIAAKPMSMRELAALLGMDPPNLTPLVDDLEQAGLVERQAHPTDRRAKVVVATAAGAELTQRAQAILDRPAAGLSGLATEDLETLVRILSEIQWDPGAGGES
jgi:DNA-binding MarR family transcriptional regulator